MSHPIVYREHIVLGNDPRVIELFPTVQATASGALVVPHGLEETKLLRNLGYAIESPMLHEYDWCKTAPFHAQMITAAHITINKRCFVLNGLGCGKTRSVLFAFDYLRKKIGMTKLLVVAPLSTLQATWMREVALVFPHLKAVLLHGSREKRLKMLASPADVYIINHDGIEVILKELKGKSFDMVCFDESTAFKTPRTDRWKAARALIEEVPWALGMTGTPTPQGPMDAYGQIKLLTPNRVPQSFNGYREMMMYKVTSFKWLPRETSTQAVLDMMQPAVRFSRAECYDLPPVQYVDRLAPMTAEQHKLYQQMTKDCTLSCARGEVTAANEADKINKLLQITLGVVYTTDHKEQRLNADPRLAALEELVEQSENKVLVFTPYKSTLNMLHEHLSKRWSTVKVSGDTPAGERGRIFGAFQLTPEPHVIVAHPACMAHGLTLTEASTVIWYGPVQSLELYEQANGRITRAGQKYSQLIVHLMSTKVEEKIYDRLRRRAQMQGLLLELFEQQILAEEL